MDTKTDMSPDSFATGEKGEVDYANSMLPANGLTTLEDGTSHTLIERTPEEETKILRKVDYRLVPLLALLYLVAFLDRSNSMSFNYRVYLPMVQRSSIKGLFNVQRELTTI
jgi:hypothetical protein